MSMERYETDDATFHADAYRVDGYDGIAWRVLGWETVPDEDTEWSGFGVRTDRVVCRMVGDDRDFMFELDDIHAIDREDYCGECGQIGCAHDGLDRGEG